LFFFPGQEELAVEISADASEANLVLQAIRSALGCSEKAAIPCGSRTLIFEVFIKALIFEVFSKTHKSKVFW
jgi:hypothetical protein